MPVRSALCAVVVAASAVMSGGAQAATCYVVFDRNDNVIYRDLFPPVDLSEAGRDERDAMRRRGEFLMFHESDVCPRIEYFTGTAGTVDVRLDQTLAPNAARKDAAATGEAPSPASPARQQRAPRKPAAR